MEGTHVLVTTEYRGVFGGRLISLDREKRIAVLGDARNCIYWDAKCKGFLGLAAVGPVGASRLGEKVTQLELFAVTSVSPISDDAAKAWGDA